MNENLKKSLELAKQLIKAAKDEELEKAKIIAGPGHAKPAGTVLADLPSPDVGKRPDVSANNPDMAAIQAQHQPPASKKPAAPKRMPGMKLKAPTWAKKSDDAFMAAFAAKKGANSCKCKDGKKCASCDKPAKVRQDAARHPNATPEQITQALGKPSPKKAG
jgi:hypothetical protein